MARILLIYLLVISVLSNCTGKRPTVAEADFLRIAYEAALLDAANPTVPEISRQLVALLPATSGLHWDDSGRVLMATWSKRRYFDYQPGEVFALHGTTWFTPVPFTAQFCSAFSGENLDLRIKQYLGLPPTKTYDAFIELWVDPKTLFRPCHDREIDDHACVVLPTEIPRSGPDHPPWSCAVRDLGSGVDPHHLAWMCATWISSYTEQDTYHNYPWTALGYTYDWGNPASPIGASEFVAFADVEVIFHRLVATAEYCGR